MWLLLLAGAAGVLALHAGLATPASVVAAKALPTIQEWHSIVFKAINSSAPWLEAPQVGFVHDDARFGKLPTVTVRVSVKDWGKADKVIRELLPSIPAGQGFRAAVEAFDSPNLALYTK